MRRGSTCTFVHFGGETRALCCQMIAHSEDPDQLPLFSNPSPGPSSRHCPRGFYWSTPTVVHTPLATAGKPVQGSAPLPPDEYPKQEHRCARNPSFCGGLRRGQFLEQAASPSEVKKLGGPAWLSGPSCLPKLPLGCSAGHTRAREAQVLLAQTFRSLVQRQSTASCHPPGRAQVSLQGGARSNDLRQHKRDCRGPRRRCPSSRSWRCGALPGATRGRRHCRTLTSKASPSRAGHTHAWGAEVQMDLGSLPRDVHQKNLHLHTPDSRRGFHSSCQRPVIDQLAIAKLFPCN
mmetsp:Transcript_21367/g.57011  ORF Transcript_21367/g.57011 Transcript_21367/m.57011 type:complete len:291 (+) Transcript_21367:276-1148(+)